MDRLALVIGPTGGFGRATATALLRHGWRVRAMHRRPDAAQPGLPQAQWVAGDAMVPADVRRAAEGAQVIVHAANPAGYRNWRGLVVPMMRATMAAARTHGARILLPGNVYNYGPDAFPRLGEDSPQHPLTRKGAIRVQMEEELSAAAQDGVKSVILRAGDFFGETTVQGWMGQVMFQAAKPLRALTYPGPLGVRHAWAYLPDLAETAARLADREADLAAHATFHFEGHVVDGHELRAAFEAAVGHALPVRPFPWPALYALAPFNEMLRELLEMRYLWRDEVVLDGRRLQAELGQVPHTPLADAISETLRAFSIPLPESARLAA